MIRYAYLAALLFSFAGVASWDLLFGPRLIARRPYQASVLLTALLLLVADLAGIALHIFMTNPAYVAGVFLGSPDLPLEEPLLLVFISYFSLVLGHFIGKERP